MLVPGRAHLFPTATVLATLAAFAPAAALDGESAGHGFHARYADDGAHLSGADGEGWRLHLRLARWGRAGSMRAPLAGPVIASAHRVEIDRGAVTEWFVDDARGLEHGFTIAAPPAPRRGGGPLALELACDGDLAPRVLPGGRDVRLVGAGGQPRLHYTGLLAWDAGGRELDARFVAEGRRLSILVEDAEASWPITIDPWIWMETAQLVASDPGKKDHLGQAVVLDGDTALVGAYRDDAAATDSGSAFVFVRQGTTWTQQTILAASDGDNGDRFGASLCLEGDTAIIGANGHETAGPFSGAAYVFVRTGTVWSEQAKLTASDANIDDLFGTAVALHGDTAVVGASSRDDPGAIYAGGVYVFERSGTLWNQRAILTADEPGVGDAFDCSLALRGDTLVCGAMFDDLGWLQDAGSAWVFVRTGTSWSRQAMLTAPDAARDRSFGRGVALDGDTVLVGTPLDEPGGHWWAGAAHAYVRSGTTWSHQAKLVADDGRAHDCFGVAISLCGDRALIAAHVDDLGSRVDAGSAYVFERNGTRWRQEAKLIASNGAGGDYFGSSVHLDGGRALIGAPLRDRPGANRAGTAYVFDTFPQASATFRNAGANPDSYVAVFPPVLGGDYQAVVVLDGTTGHAMAGLVAYSAPLTFSLPGGQVLLVDVLDPAGELLAHPFLPGPTAYVTIAIPNDPALAGFEAATQALHFGGVSPFALSNAQDLLLGF